MAGQQRLADLLAGLSRLADIGFGLPTGESVRAAAVAADIAHREGLHDDDVGAAVYGALLLHLGCIGYSHETARLFDDELVMNAAVALTNVADPRDVATSFVPALLRGRAPLAKARLVVVALTRGRRFGLAYESTACEVGRVAARRLRLSDSVQRNVHHAYERWNGDGVPEGLAGDDIPIGSRIASLATVAAVFDSLGGTDAALDAVRAQSGSILDPRLVDGFSRWGASSLAEVAAADPHQLVLEAEPVPRTTVANSQLAAVAEVFGDVADLKTPWFHGHARAVARLARGAGERLDLDKAIVDDLEIAALLRDLGRVAVPNSVWEKPGPLSRHEWEQVRLHAYHSERIVAGSSALASIASLVGMHHERLDGSGYHRGCTSAQIPLSARILAAADSYHGMRSARPHRPARSADEAERQLLVDVGDGRLDADAVTAVLAAAGHDAEARRELPAGLSGREAEVLALVARGCTNKDIAERLFISRRTAEHHVQHVYAKLGVSSRAAAALFAIEHDLVAPDG
jgi:HD-GYP domain-containing protein (c-di-GMP phosphodiesterase class II)